MVNTTTPYSPTNTLQLMQDFPELEQEVLDFIADMDHQLVTAHATIQALQEELTALQPKKRGKKPIYATEEERAAGRKRSQQKSAEKRKILLAAGKAAQAANTVHEVEVVEDFSNGEVASLAPM